MGEGASASKQAASRTELQFLRPAEGKVSPGTWVPLPDAPPPGSLAVQQSPCRRQPKQCPPPLRLPAGLPP
eukprot:1173641-Prorocentrum_lima.AAC.1